MSYLVKVLLRWKAYVIASMLLVSVAGLHGCSEQTVSEANAQAAAVPTAQSDIPRLANGKPDFSGIWQSISGADYDLEPHGHREDASPGAGVVEGKVLPYLPEALAQKQKNFAERKKLDPALKGYTLGVPRGIYYPAPFQIFQRERDLFIVHQFGHSVRTIFNYHSDVLKVLERWTFLDRNTIEYQATVTDEKVFSRPWTLSVILHRHREKDFQLIEDYRFTMEYDEFYPPKPPANP